MHLLYSKILIGTCKYSFNYAYGYWLYIVYSIALITENECKIVGLSKTKVINHY